MKRLIALVLGMLMLVSCMCAIAEDSTFAKFQPYTQVDLGVLEKAGFTSSFDNYKFTAEFYPPTNTISGKDSFSGDDTLSITLDIKAVYSAGTCLLVPRMIFKRAGYLTYSDSRMADVYIRNGENRYHVDLSGVSRSSSSKYYSATDTCVEPLRTRGLIMLADLATNPMDISVMFGNSLVDFTLTDSDKAVFKTFYDTCKEAGIFDQNGLHEYSDNYYVVTLFNNGSVGTEDAVSEEEPAPTEE